MNGPLSAPAASPSRGRPPLWLEVAAAAVLLLAGAMMGFESRRFGASAPKSVEVAAWQDPQLRGRKLVLAESDLPRTVLHTYLSDAVAHKTISGGVLLISAPDMAPYLDACGTDVAGAPIAADAVFDLASLTKAVATAPLILKLAASGAFTLETPIARWFPGFRGPAARITVRQLLTHSSGLPPGLNHQVATPVEDAIARERLDFRPGDRFQYSDLGYALLGRIIELETRKSLAAAANELIFNPAGMKDTGFLPDPGARARAAATLGEHREVLKGTVQDPLARQLGGAAGNAGVFSTVRDLNRFIQMLLNDGRVGGTVVLPAAADRLLTSPILVDAQSTRGLGMDIDSRYSSPRGDLLPFGSFGHTGYTGTSLWVDRESGVGIVFLSTGKTEKTAGELNELRRTFANVVAGALRPEK